MLADMRDTSVTDQRYQAVLDMAQGTFLALPNIRVPSSAFRKCHTGLGASKLAAGIHRGNVLDKLVTACSLAPYPGEGQRNRQQQ